MPAQAPVTALWLWLYLAALFLLYFAFLLLMMRRAFRHAQLLGIERTQLLRAVQGVLLPSFLAAIPILIVTVSLLPLFGGPLASQSMLLNSAQGIESNHSSISQIAVNQAGAISGEGLSMQGYSLQTWHILLCLLSFAGAIGILWAALAIRPIAAAQERLRQKGHSRAIALVGGAFVCAALGAATANKACDSMASLLAFAVALVIGVALQWLQKRAAKPHPWLEQLQLGICMLGGMLAAMLAARAGLY